MSKVSVENYGRPFRQYGGTASFQDSNGQERVVQVQATVTHDAKIIIAFEGLFSDEVWDDELRSLNRLELDGLSVTLSNLRTGYVSSDFVAGGPVKGRAICLTRDLLIGARHGRVLEAFYYVTNLRLIRNMEWHFEGHAIRLEHVNSYQHEIAYLKASKQIGVTCRIRVTRTDNQPLDLETVERMMDDLALLLSLARGTTVQWISSEWKQENQTAINSYHRNMKLSQYGNLEIICAKPPMDLYEFVQSSYPKFREVNQQLGLPKAIRQLVSGGLEENGYIELRALSLTTLLDFLRSRFADASNDGGYFIHPDTFTERKAELKKRIRSVLTDLFPDTGKAIINEMSLHSLGFYRKSFRASLQEMLEHLRLEIAGEELTRFVEIRNHLVHEGSFLPPDTHGPSWEQFTACLSVVSRVLLAILKYEGYYYDWAKHVPNEWEGPESTGRVRLQLLPEEPGHSS